MQRWKIEKDGYTFHCTYDSNADWVEVTCYGIDCRPKGALGKASGPELIANILASEIIRENT
jgi:hypothetical protein